MLTYPAPLCPRPGSRQRVLVSPFLIHHASPRFCSNSSIALYLSEGRKLIRASVTDSKQPHSSSCCTGRLALLSNLEPICTPFLLLFLGSLSAISAGIPCRVPAPLILHDLSPHMSKGFSAFHCQPVCVKMIQTIFWCSNWWTRGNVILEGSDRELVKLSS